MSAFGLRSAVAVSLVVALFGVRQTVEAGQAGAATASVAAPQAPAPASEPSAAQPSPAVKPSQAVAPKPVLLPVGTMSDLMVKIIYPTSDAVFYITTRVPQDAASWAELEAKTLMLAEAGNLLMMPAHQRDEDRWLEDARLMRDAGAAAYKAAKAKDVKALDDLNDALYQSCVTCHQHYRRNYGRGR